MIFLISFGRYGRNEPCLSIDKEPKNRYFLKSRFLIRHDSGVKIVIYDPELVVSEVLSLFWALFMEEDIIDKGTFR